MMTSKARVNAAINHQEADRVPYDIGGTTVTTITKNAYKAALQSSDVAPRPISRI